jgi:hypothetical protein
MNCGLRTDLRPDACPAPYRLCPAEGEMCKTNPISGPAGWGGVTGARGVGESCKTNPISPAGRHPGGNRAKQSQLAPRKMSGGTPNPRRAEGQSCETNPIWPGLGRARSPAAGNTKRTQFPGWSPRHPKPVVRNEPNSRRRRVGRGPRGVGRGANVQNEPNLGGVSSVKFQV